MPSAFLERAGEGRCGVFHLELIPDLGSEQIQLEVPSAGAVCIKNSCHTNPKEQLPCPSPCGNSFSKPLRGGGVEKRGFSMDTGGARAGFGMATAHQYVNKMYLN